jgi:hypothetical protein
MYQMSKSKATKKKPFPTEKLVGWDGLIAAARQRIQDLEFSVRVFEQKKAAGEAPLSGVPLKDSQLIQAATR